MLDAILKGKGWIGLLILRLAIAFILVPGGWHKLNDLGGTAEGFAKMGIPLPAVGALLAGLAEFAGGLCLAVGLLTRYAAFFVSFTLFVAVLTHFSKGPRGYGFALMVGAGALCLLFTGAGPVAIDALRTRRR